MVYKEKPIRFTYLNPKTGQGIEIHNELWIYECPDVRSPHGLGYDIYVPDRFKNKRVILISLDDMDESLAKKIKILCDKVIGRTKLFNFK